MLEKEVKINVKFTLAEFRRSRMRMGIVDLILVPVVIFMLMYYFAPHIDLAVKSGVSAQIWKTVGFTAAAVLLFPFLMFNKYFLQSKKIFDNNAFLSDGSDYEMNADGVKWSHSGQSGELKWEDLFRIKETGEFYYLFLNKKSAVILPKKDIADCESDFRETVASVLGKNAQLKKR